MNESKFSFSNLKTFLMTHKKVAAVGFLVAALFLFGGNWLLQRVSQSNQTEEIDLVFDAEGPYALLFPRKDGNAINLNLLRTSSYDSITYELAYTSNQDETVVEGTRITDDGEAESGGGAAIDRGVVGTINIEQKRGEYEQEILFGTCSKNVCKYDKGVENGTLTLYIKKGNKTYRMVTQWHLQQPDIALGNLTSLDGHFSYKVDADREALTLVGYTIINDLTAVPKLPPGKVVLGKVYALNIPIAKQLPGGAIELVLAENPPANSKIYRHNGNDWEELDTKIEGSKLTTKANGAGIFVVLTSK